MRPRLGTHKRLPLLSGTLLVRAPELRGVYQEDADTSAHSSFYLRSTLLLCTVGLVCVAANACGDGPASPSRLSGNANLSVMLTDAPIDGVEQVNIYFTSVTVKPEGTPV